MYALNQYVVVSDVSQEINDVLGMIVDNKMTGDNYTVRLSDGSKRNVVVSQTSLRIASRQEIIENNQVSV